MEKTLKGIFPQPKVPPKRNFIKENVKRLRDTPKTPCLLNSAGKGTTEKPSTAGGGRRSKPSTPFPKKNVTDEMQIIKAAPKIFSKVQSDSPTSSRSRTSSIGSDQVESAKSTTRDMCSQTGDVNDELFLKDVIIRIPSASILNQIKQKNLDENLDKTEAIRNAIQHKPVSSKKNKPVFSIEDQEPASDLSSGDDHILRQSNHLNKLKEFLEKNSITKLDKENFTKNEQTLVMNFRKRSEIRKKKIAETRSSDSRESNCDDFKSSSSSISFTSLSYEATKSQAADSVKFSKMDIPASYRAGELPKYLREMKQKQEDKQKQDAMIDAACPAGHVALSNKERTEALIIAQQRYQQLIEELNKMSMTSQTMKLKNRKMEIDKELNKLEDNIRTFSRPKVYVKVDE